MTPLFPPLLASARIAAGVMALLAGLIVTTAPEAQAQTFTVLHNFTGAQDGYYPTSGVTVDRAGNLYGTAQYGGSGTWCYINCGTVFKLTRKGSSWLTAPLYEFQGNNDGGNPFARVIIGPNGSLYGTTNEGGRNCYLYGCGTVFNLQQPAHAGANVLGAWTETVLYRFAGGSDGANPYAADLAFDDRGNFYGTTGNGGDSNQCQDGCGTVYKMTYANGTWTESVIHSFAAYVDGQPWAGVTFDAAGNLYGTTKSSGPRGSGAVYELVPSGNGWTERVLYSFSGSDGAYPYSGIILDSAGNLYGTTCCGGAHNGGTVFELVRSGANFTMQTLYNFPAPGGPYGNVAIDAAGNVYGSTQEGGAYNRGIIFRLSPATGGWVFADLHDFDGTDGSYPFGDVTFDASGNLYGTTTSGGAYNAGVVWELTP